MGGGRGLWRLWQAMSVHLAAGCTVESLTALSAAPRTRTAISTILAQLHEHDLLVNVPPSWGESGRDGEPPALVASWLATVSTNPVTAWSVLRSATVTVDGRGPVAAAAARACHGAGVSVRRTLRDAAAGTVLRAGDLTVAGVAGPDLGFVTPVSEPAHLSRVVTVLSERLSLRTVDGAAAPVLAALVGGAAGHRLLCALTGMPDPSEDEFARPAGLAVTGVPMVLVARLDPLRAEYHPWPGGVHGPVVAVPRDPGALTPADHLSRLDPLTDPELGVLAAVEFAQLPQLPAGLAVARGLDAVRVGVGTNVEMARLTAMLGAIEATCGPTTPVGVGVDATHARGVALRRLVHERAADLPGEDVDETWWAHEAAARRWWKAATLRFALPVQVRVRRLGAAAYHACVVDGEGVRGWAVEASAADAVAFAALAAVGRAQWREAGGAADAVVCAPCGALPGAHVPVPDAASWLSGYWTWPAACVANEEPLQGALHDLAGRPELVRWSGDSVLGSALGAVGCVALEMAR
jgi:hypothetical protein